MNSNDQRAGMGNHRRDGKMCAIYSFHLSQNSLRDNPYFRANCRIFSGTFLASQMPLSPTSFGDSMIIFILTFAIISLFALTLTGSIASTTTARRRS
jgi:hypothetical protein